MTAYEIMERNAKFEQECLEQAKRELRDKCNSPIDFVMQTVKRAQEIKLERKAKGEGQ